jgi:tripartite-type tricarboxylate transporter receptor subunit TctC
MKNRTLFGIFLTLLFSVFTSINAYAQTAAVKPWPNRTVKIVSGLGPGSSMDLVARIIAPTLSELWKQPVIVDNRVGAAGNVAAGLVAHTDDDHTLLIAQNAITISASLYPKLSYDIKKDLRLVTQLTSMPLVVLVNSSLPVKNIKELIDYAKQRPNQLNFSSAGIGNADHMATELFNAKAGISMVHVPFTSGSLALNALMGGSVQVYLAGLPVSLPQIKAGKVLALAVTTPQRATALPNVPTVAEAVSPGFAMPLWYGIFASPVASESTVRQISADISKALKSSELQNKIGAMGIDLVGSSPDAFKTFIYNDLDLWGDIIRAKNLKPE